jgi:hypothetical protein
LEGVAAANSDDFFAISALLTAKPTPWQESARTVIREFTLILVQAYLACLSIYTRENL